MRKERGQSTSAGPVDVDNGDSGAVMPAQLMARCPACGQPEALVWVHGHGQCAHCHMNVMPCCDGAVCDPT